jgi:hypothetical protein
VGLRAQYVANEIGADETGAACYKHILQGYSRFVPRFDGP